MTRLAHGDQRVEFSERLVGTLFCSAALGGVAHLDRFERQRWLAVKPLNRATLAGRLAPKRVTQSIGGASFLRRATVLTKLNSTDPTVARHKPRPSASKHISSQGMPSRPCTLCPGNHSCTYPHRTTTWQRARTRHPCSHCSHFSTNHSSWMLQVFASSLTTRATPTAHSCSSATTTTTRYSTI